MSCCTHIFRMAEASGQVYLRCAARPSTQTKVVCSALRTGLPLIWLLRCRGKRAGVFGAYLLAIYNEESEEYQTISKIGTGFSEEQLKELADLLRPLTIPEPRSYYRSDITVILLCCEGLPSCIRDEAFLVCLRQCMVSDLISSRICYSPLRPTWFRSFYAKAVVPC